MERGLIADYENTLRDIRGLARSGQSRALRRKLLQCRRKSAATGTSRRATPRARNPARPDAALLHPKRRACIGGLAGGRVLNFLERRSSPAAFCLAAPACRVASGPADGRLAARDACRLGDVRQAWRRGRMQRRRQLRFSAPPAAVGFVVFGLASGGLLSRVLFSIGLASCSIGLASRSTGLPSTPSGGWFRSSRRLRRTRLDLTRLQRRSAVDGCFAWAAHALSAGSPSPGLPSGSLLDSSSDGPVRRQPLCLQRCPRFPLAPRRRQDHELAGLGGCRDGGMTVIFRLLNVS